MPPHGAHSRPAMVAPADVEAGAGSFTRTRVDAPSTNLPPTTVWGTFRDARLEAEFRNERVRPGLERGLLAVSVALVLPVGAYFSVVALASERASGPAVALMGAALGVLVLCSVVAHGARRLGSMPLGATEALATLCFSTLAHLLQVNECGRLLWMPAGPACELDAHTAVADGILAAMRLALLLVSTSLFTPLRTPLFVVFGANAVAGVALANAGAGPEHTARAALGVLMCAALVALAVLVRLNVDRAARVTWHYERTVRHTLADVETLQASKTRAAVELGRTEAAKAARSRLIRVFMHDVRSPLLSVTSIATTLRTMPATTRLANPTVSLALETLQSCARVMENVVSDMLDFERIDSGELALDLEGAFTLARLLAGAEHSFSRAALAKDIELEFDPLDEALGAAVFEGDVRRLHQCVSNGLSNAIKFTPNGGRVCVSARSGPSSSTGPHSSVFLTITDSGVGLTEEEVSAINSGELFVQVGRGQLQGSGGTGLGLGVTRQILAMHNGSQLRVRSEGPGRGATLEYELMLCHAAAEKAVALGPTHVLSGECSNASGSPEGGTRLHGTSPSPPPGSQHGSRHPPWSSVKDGPDATGARDADESDRTTRSRLTTTSSLATSHTRGAALSIASTAVNDDAEPSVAAGGSSIRTAPALGGSCGKKPADAANGRRTSGLLAAAARKLSVSDESARDNAAAAAAAASAGSRGVSFEVGAIAHSPELRLRAELVEELPDDFCCLHVEDDMFVKFTLPLQTFDVLGAPYEQADDGVQAIDRVLHRGKPYSVIVLDNQMPNMSGTVCARELRANGYEGLIVGMTGDPQGSEERFEFEASGLNECLDKDTAGMQRLVHILRDLANGLDPVQRTPRSAPKISRSRQTTL